MQEILAIAERIISGNRVLNVKMFYKEVRKYIRTDHKTLLETINYLLEKRILVEGSKLTKDIVLINAHRKNIYEYIRDNGGANFSTIREEYEGSTGSPGQLIWHLQVLLQFKYIKKIKFKRFTIFLPAELEEDQGLLSFLLRDELTKKMLELLNTHEMLKKTELVQYFDAPREKIYYRLNLLQEANLLALSGEAGKEVCINPGRKEEIADLVDKLNKDGGRLPNDNVLDS